MRKNIGDTVDVSLAIGDQDEVEVHPALQDFIDSNEHVKHIWDALTPGKNKRFHTQS